MTIDWRALFNDIRVPWRDKGPNCSRGNVNICCPFCRNDPSFHLSVSEARKAYYCFREPNRHSGVNLEYLLLRLGVGSEECLRLLRRFTIYSEKVQPAQQSSSEKSPDRLIVAWNRHVNASYSREAMAYLASRGFPDPQALCLRYDLRIATEGTWASRILIPYYRDGVIETWTGRALFDHMSPKYLMQTKGHDTGLIYAPAQPYYPKRRLIVVEGQFDALKIAAAVDERQYTVVSLAGKFLNASKLIRILDLFPNGCPEAIIALDGDVSQSTAYGLLFELASPLRCSYIHRARLPSYAKDPADLSLPEIPGWLNAQFSRPP